MKYFLSLTFILLLSMTPSLMGQQFKLEIDASYGINKFIDSDEKLAFAAKDHYSFKLGVSRELSDRMSFQLGIMYRHFSDQDRNYSLVIFGCDLPIEFGGQGQKSVIVSDFSVNYIGVPLGLKYKMTKKPSFLYTKLGGEFLAYLAKNIDSKILECGTNEISHDFQDNDSYASLLIIPNIALGYQLSKENISYHLELSLGRSVNKLFDQEHLGFFPGLSVESLAVSFFELRSGVSF